MTMTPVERSDTPDAQFDERCLELHRQGASLRSIARQLSTADTTISHTVVQRAIRRARGAEDPIDPLVERVNLYRSLDRTALELHAIISEQNGDKNRKVRAAVALVAVVDQRAKLVGAHAPVVRELQVTTFTQEALDDEQARIERELLAAGIDVGELPSVDELTDWIEARATVKDGPEPIEVAWP